MLDLQSSKGAHVAERLKTEPIIWLGSTRPDGRPHLVPVWFLWDGQSLLIFSKPDQKIRNLRQNPNVTLALDNTNRGSDVVLIEGQAALLDEPTSTLMSEAYLDKYGAMIAAMQWQPETMAADYSQAIRVQPTRFLFW